MERIELKKDLFDAVTALLQDAPFRLADTFVRSYDGGSVDAQAMARVFEYIATTPRHYADIHGVMKGMEHAYNAAVAGQRKVDIEKKNGIPEKNLDKESD